MVSKLKAFIDLIVKINLRVAGSKNEFIHTYLSRFSLKV